MSAIGQEAGASAVWSTLCFATRRLAASGSESANWPAFTVPCWARPGRRSKSPKPWWPRPLASPAAEAARASRRVLRETPFLLPLAGDAERRIVEGAIDLAYLEDGGKWIVVDWKTDLGDLEAPAAGDSGANGMTRGDLYRRQVRWYCYALEQLTGAPASGRLVLL